MFKKIVLTLEIELHKALNILTKPIGFVLMHFATSWTVLLHSIPLYIQQRSDEDIDRKWIWEIRYASQMISY